MRLKPVRVRHLLFVVVAFAVLIEAGGVGPRWRQYHRRYRQEGWQTEEYLLASRRFEAIAIRLRGELADAGSAGHSGELRREIEDAENQADGFRQLAEWSGRTGRQYREAMYRPWSVAPPDPPFIHRNP